jgi:hypothetical protein
MIHPTYSCPVRGTSHAENLTLVGMGPKNTARKVGWNVSKERRENKGASQRNAIPDPTGSTGPVSHQPEKQISGRGGDKPRRGQKVPTCMEKEGVLAPGRDTRDRGTCIRFPVGGVPPSLVRSGC